MAYQNISIELHKIANLTSDKRYESINCLLEYIIHKENEEYDITRKNYKQVILHIKQLNCGALLDSKYPKRGRISDINKQRVGHCKIEWVKKGYYVERNINDPEYIFITYITKPTFLAINETNNIEFLRL